MTAQPKCLNCESTGWVCENHPHVSWGEGDNCCGGAGDPCPVCNTEMPPRMPADSTVVWTAADGWVH